MSSRELDAAVIEAFGEALEDANRKTGQLVAGLNRRIDETKQLALSSRRTLDAAAKPKTSARSVLVRSILVKAIAVLSRYDAEETAERLYGKSEKLAEALKAPGNFVAKAATSPAQTTVSGWAAELVGTSRNYGLIASLAANSVYSQLVARGVGADLGGMASMKFLSRPVPSSMPPIFVGEGQPIPCRELDFDSAPLLAHKAAVISTLSGEVARYSTPAAEGVIGQALSDDLGIGIDTALLDANPASAIRPAGLLNGLAALTASTATSPADAAASDIAALARAIVPGAVSLALIAASAQAASLALLYGNSALDIISTDALPPGTVLAIDASDFAAVVEPGGSIDVSDGATVVAKTDPLPVSTGTSGAAAITDAPHTSLWQHDLLGVRVVESVGWQMRRAGRVAFVQNVAW